MDYLKTKHEYFGVLFEVMKIDRNNFKKLSTKRFKSFSFSFSAETVHQKVKQQCQNFDDVAASAQKHVIQSHKITESVATFSPIFSSHYVSIKYLCFMSNHNKKASMIWRKGEKQIRKFIMWMFMTDEIKKTISISFNLFQFFSSS